MQKRNPLKYAALLSVLLTQLATGSALAQSSNDNPIVALPEVMLVLDSSGSMLFGGYNGTGTKPACTAYTQPDESDAKQCVANGKICSAWGVNPFSWGGVNWNCTYCCKTWNGGTTTYRSRQEAIREVLVGTYDPTMIGTCSSNQQKNGLLDTYNGLIRFGFSEFDNMDINTPNPTLWDYGNNCGNSGIRNRTSSSGALIDVALPSNPDDVLTNNTRVQTAVCGSDAMNGTPITGALSDAYWYFQNWHNEVSPVYVDPLSSCRSHYVILLTDGQDNGPTNNCSCTSPTDCAQKLFNGQNIITFVVGFGDPSIVANLNAIAQAGSGGVLNAFYAVDGPTLQLQLAIVLNTVLASTNSRTAPTSAPSTAVSNQSYRYTTYFQVSGVSSSWRGHVIRETVTLDASGNPIYSNPIDFANTLAAQSYSSRKIFTATQDPGV